MKQTIDLEATRAALAAIGARSVDTVGPRAADIVSGRLDLWPTCLRNEAENVADFDVFAVYGGAYQQVCAVCNYGFVSLRGANDAEALAQLLALMTEIAPCIAWRDGGGK